MMVMNEASITVLGAVRYGTVRYSTYVASAPPKF